jgi:hypothetical protein
MHFSLALLKIKIPEEGDIYNSDDNMGGRGI